MNLRLNKWVIGFSFLALVSVSAAAQDFANDPETGGAISTRNGDIFAGDSNTQCLGMGSNDRYHCFAQMVAYDESGKEPAGPPLIANGGWQSINLLDESWYYLVANRVMPGDTGNPIAHLMIGTNNVTGPNATTSDQLHQVSQVMYELATWATTSPEEKYFPDDPDHATTTGTWTPQYEFFFVSEMSGGSGYSVGDTLTPTDSRLSGTELIVDSVNESGLATNFHMARYPDTSTYACSAPCRTTGARTTGGKGSGLTFQIVDNNRALHVLQSTGSSESVQYSNIETELGCAVLIYQQWPGSGNTPDYGAVNGSTFSVYADGSRTALVDSITGSRVLSSNLANDEQPRAVDRYQGSYFGLKAARFCGLGTGKHTFTIDKATRGWEAILALIAPRVPQDADADGPNLNVIGILPIYPGGKNGKAPQIAQYNSIYTDIVDDLQKKMRRRIVFTDDSTVDMVDIPSTSWADPNTVTRVTKCALGKGKLTITGTNVYSAGDVVQPTNLVACAVANHLNWTVQSSGLSSSRFTAVLASEGTTAAERASTATVASTADSGITELTWDGWIVNTAFGPAPYGLHMPQLQQSQLARLVHIVDSAAAMASKSPLLNLGETLAAGRNGLPTVRSDDTDRRRDAGNANGRVAAAPL